MLLVRCPGCGHDQKYRPIVSARQASPLAGKKKRCVYCGRTFTVHASSPKSRIVGSA